MEAAKEDIDALRQAMRDAKGDGKVRRKLKKSLPPALLPYQGLQMRVHPADNFTEFLIWMNGETREEEELAYLCDKVRGQRIRMLDVGANAGLYSLRLAAVADPASIFDAFEPNPTMMARLTENISLNNLSQIRTHPCAIGAEEAELELQIPARLNLGEARIGEPFKNGRSITVPVRTLAAFAPTPSEGRVDVLKVDVEGLEDQVVVPFLDTVPAEIHPRYILLEHKRDGGWKMDLMGALLRHNYRSDRVIGGNTIFINAAAEQQG